MRCRGKHEGDRRDESVRGAADPARPCRRMATATQTPRVAALLTIVVRFLRRPPDPAAEQPKGPAP
jgi:hypothetical protein